VDGCFSWEGTEFKAVLRTDITAGQAADAGSGEIITGLGGEIDRAGFLAEAAFGAAQSVKGEAEEGDPVEKPINQAQGAGGPAEEAKDEDRTDEEEDQEGNLEEVESSDQGADLGTEDPEGDSALERSDRTDKTAETRASE
jgi:hypothetical protein